MWCIPFYQNYMKNKERNLKKKKTNTVYTCESIPLHLNLCSATVLAELVPLLEKLNWKNVDGKRELEKQSVRILFILWVSEYCNKSQISAFKQNWTINNEHTIFLYLMNWFFFSVTMDAVKFIILLWHLSYKDLLPHIPE